MDAQPTRRRWFQIRLRTILLLMVAASAVAKLAHERSIVSMRQKLLDYRVGILNSTDQPLWHKTVFGEDSLGCAMDVSLHDPVDSETLDALSKKVEWLQLDDVGFEDDIVGWLKTLTRLRYLDIRRTRISDANKEELSRTLPKCRILKNWEFP